MLELLPVILALVIVVALTCALIKVHRRALRAEEGKDYAESQMALVMKFRGLTPERLEDMDRAMGRAMGSEE